MQTCCLCECHEAKGRKALLYIHAPPIVVITVLPVAFNVEVGLTIGQKTRTKLRALCGVNALRRAMLRRRNVPFNHFRHGRTGFKRRYAESNI